MILTRNAIIEDNNATIVFEEASLDIIYVFEVLVFHIIYFIYIEEKRFMWNINGFII